MPDSASTPMWGFIPKWYCFPLLVWCISRSREPPSFVVEQGAEIKVTSIAVPILNKSNLDWRIALTSTNLILVTSNS